MRLIFTLLLLTFCSVISFSQETEKGFKLSGVGVETQVYPAGTIVQLKGSFPISNHAELIGKFGYNNAQRQDFGKHDNEEGGGFGGGLAYRYYLKENHAGWFAEARTNIWNLEIDWRDNTPAASGTTDITVFQPTLGFGYDFLLKNEKIKLAIMAGFGYEINVKTVGQEVGEGGISLIGASFVYNLR